MLAASRPGRPASHAAALERLGVELHRPRDTHDGRIALPELLEDLAARGMASVLVEGGAKIAQGVSWTTGWSTASCCSTAPDEIGDGGDRRRRSTPSTCRPGFAYVREMRFGDDICAEWVRDI